MRVRRAGLLRRGLAGPHRHQNKLRTHVEFDLAGLHLAQTGLVPLRAAQPCLGRLLPARQRARSHSALRSLHLALYQPGHSLSLADAVHHQSPAGNTAFGLLLHFRQRLHPGTSKPALHSRPRLENSFGSAAVRSRNDHQYPLRQHFAGC